MANLILYGTESSPPVRAVLLTLRALQLDHEFHTLDMQAGDHLKPDMLPEIPSTRYPCWRMVSHAFGTHTPSSAIW